MKSFLALFSLAAAILAAPAPEPDQPGYIHCVNNSAMGTNVLEMPGRKWLCMPSNTYSYVDAMIYDAMCANYYGKESCLTYYRQQTTSRSLGGVCDPTKKKEVMGARVTGSAGKYWYCDVRKRAWAQVTAADYQKRLPEDYAMVENYPLSP